MRRKGFLHLTVEAVERIHERVLAAHGGSPGLRDKRFVDGNKRTALASALVFLQVNNLLEDDELPSRDVDAWEALVLDIAASKLDREQTAERLRRLLSAKQP